MFRYENEQPPRSPSGAVSFSASANARVEQGEPYAAERFREGTTVTFEPTVDEIERKIAKKAKEEFF